MAWGLRDCYRKKERGITGVDDGQRKGIGRPDIRGKQPIMSKSKNISHSLQQALKIIHAFMGTSNRVSIP